MEDKDRRQHRGPDVPSPPPPPQHHHHPMSFLDIRVTAPAEQYWRDLRHMPMRDDDVIIAAYPKSGTHWLWEVVTMLTSRQVAYESRAKEFFMLEFNDVESFAQLKSPRVLNTHLLLRHLSQEVETKRVPVLHVLRNPKDVLVSLYFHWRQRHADLDEGFTAFARMMLQGGGLPGSYQDYFAYLPAMEAWERDHPHLPLINIYFEDMKQNPLGTVKEVSRFLGVPASDAFCQEVVKACSFDRLKSADSAKQQLNTKFKHIDLYRKGEVGDWKNHFTVALSEQFDAAIAERLKDYAYVTKLKYTI